MSERESAYTTLVEPQEVTCNVQGSVYRAKSTGMLYVSLWFGNSLQYMAHAQLARELRDWLIANVPDDE